MFTSNKDLYNTNMSHYNLCGIGSQHSNISKVFYLNSQRNKNVSGSFQPDQEKACNICPFQRFQYFPKA